MSLLNLLLYEVEKNGGIAKTYEVANLELMQFEKQENEAIVLNLRRMKEGSIMNVRTGKVFKSCAEAARSINILPRYFQNAIKRDGRYLSFVKVA